MGILALMTAREDFTVEADDGHPVAARWWAPASPQGLVQIVHGMAEHCARYERVAEKLNEAGWAVIAHDHRGHGATAAANDLGHYGDEGGLRRVVADMRRVRREGRARQPEGRLVLLGHSMGSFLSLFDQCDAPGEVDALVLSGSNELGGAAVKAGRAVAKLERLRLGKRGKSALLAFLSFGSFNKAFQPVRTEFDWLSRDADEVDAYIADPLSGFRCTNQLWVDFLGALDRLGDPAFRRRLPSTLPVYLMAGEKDPVGGARGVAALEAQLRGAGLTDVTRKIYPGGRHEMFNETNRDEVVSDLIAFLAEQRA
ncbi:MAG: alpha/beta hydrolase [Sandaracinaceae bacterium]